MALDTDALYLPDKGVDMNQPIQGGARRASRKRTYLFVAVLVMLFIGLGVALGVALGVKHHNTSGSGTPGQPSQPSSSGKSKPGSTSGIIYGGDGTVVTTEDGTQFTYQNKFGGYFVQDPNDPFNNNARAQSWSPALNETWQWGKDQVLG